MKKVLLTLLALSLFSANAQVATYKLKQEEIDKFKGTETIFILSDIYDKAVYEEALKEAWTITPYKVINSKDFNALDYINDKHSFGVLEGWFKSTGKTVTLDIYVGFFLFDMKEKTKELEKFAKMSEKKKKDYKLLKENRIGYGNFRIFPDAEFIKSANRSGTKELDKMLYGSPSFHNYKPGFLRNYIQEMNRLLSIGEPSSLFGGRCTPEVKVLKKQTLFIPDYMMLKYDALSVKEKPMSEKDIKKLLEDYKYKCEIISADAISDKIIAGEDFYYVRFVRESSQRYIEVVNSKTGNIVFHAYYAGFSYNLKNDQFEDIKKAIDTGKV